MLPPDLRLPAPLDRPPLAPAESAQARALLQSIGWDRSALVQVALYARQSPAQKIAQMGRIRRAVMTVFRARLAAENPTLAPRALDLLVCRRIAEYYRLYP